MCESLHEYDPMTRITSRCLVPMCQRPRFLDTLTCYAHGSAVVVERQDKVEVFGLVKHDLDKRNAKGWIEHCKPLYVESKLDWMTELYEELLDACVYLRGELELRRREEGSGQAGTSGACDYSRHDRRSPGEGSEC